ncbi:response regulator transcription factor [Zestomonas carbonaria]|uniref:Virulence factors putative positive transcription regulator BvgA n=1 Tax=Zestomonas carbonaria TaxID=2762745 RepID=A0A7U7ETR1_9GAMM|nr:response regulator transcription factor [Pseudomonas carbonaria]CAD5110525.1 Virulence factors putative positive transcription regulator BvgA [Pseudomonas carbonaria]
MHKALIVDDHPFIRSGVRALLEANGFQVVAETDNGANVLRLAQDHQPELIILDIGIPKLDGLEVLARLRALSLPVKVLVLTAQSPEYFAMRCMRAGASGFIPKGDDIDELSKAVSAIMSGYTYFPSLSTQSVFLGDGHLSESEKISSLSDRELLVLQYLARGLSNKEIAELLLLSNKTVSTYKVRVLEKLRLASVVDLADFAKRNGLI